MEYDFLSGSYFNSDGQLCYASPLIALNAFASDVLSGNATQRLMQEAVAGLKESKMEVNEKYLEMTKTQPSKAATPAGSGKRGKATQPKKYSLSLSNRARK